MHLDGTNSTQIDLGSNRTRSDETDSSQFDRARAISPKPNPPPRPKTSPATPTTATPRGGAFRCVSRRGVRRWVAGAPSLSVRRRRARGRSGGGAELAAARATSAVGISGVVEFTWWRRSSGGSATGRGAATAEIGDAAACGGARRRCGCADEHSGRGRVRCTGCDARSRAMRGCGRWRRCGDRCRRRPELSE